MFVTLAYKSVDAGRWCSAEQILTIPSPELRSALVKWHVAMMFRTFLNCPPQVLCPAVTCHDTDVLLSQAISCQQKMSVTSLSGWSGPCVTNRLLTTCRFANQTQTKLWCLFHKQCKTVSNTFNCWWHWKVHTSDLTLSASIAENFL